MATIRNPWVGYLDRNFRNIKQRILERLGQTVPEVTDHSDSNILVVIIESFAGVAEMLSYYIDNMAREAFITTARRYSSVVKHTRLIDYRIKAMIPASLDITIEFLDEDGNPYPIPGEILIPSGVIFSTANGVQFIHIQDRLIPAGTTSVDLICKQKTKVNADNLGLTLNDPDQVFPLGKEYVHNSLELTIGGEPWLLKDTLGLSGPLDNVFIVEVSANKEAYIRFGDGINGAIPTSGLPVVADYYISLGSLGNIEAMTIINSSLNFETTYSIHTVNIANIYRAVAGTDFESIERIRRSAPLSLRTLDRAVTRQDYEDIALLAPGIDKAKVFFECGKYVYLYISPNGGGLANDSLLTDVNNWFMDKKMVTTFVKALPAGESELHFNLNVTARFRVDGIQLKTELITLLLDAYSYTKSKINKPIRVSDLISLIDNYPQVDFLTLEGIYLKPYIRPVGNLDVVTPLNYNITLNQGNNSNIDWRIRFDGTYMKLFRSGTPITNLEIGTEFTDDLNNITITILPGSYIMGMEWKFTTLPINKDIIINDFSVPVLKESNINLIVNEQLS